MISLFRESSSKKMFEAVVSNNIEAVKSLIKSGVDVNKRNEYGGFPLKLASGKDI